MSSLSDLDKEIQNYKSLIYNISELFLKYLIFKRDNKQLSQQVINGLHSYFLDFKFMRLKLLYGTDEWDKNNNVSSSSKTKEQELNKLETEVFGQRIDASGHRWEKTSRKLKTLPQNIAMV
jgi:hypothetical protein